MTIDKASEKSIRLTALDANGEVKVFLIMVRSKTNKYFLKSCYLLQSSIEDSNKLFSNLQERLDREITTQKRKKFNTANDSGGDC